MMVMARLSLWKAAECVKVSNKAISISLMAHQQPVICSPTIQNEEARTIYVTANIAFILYSNLNQKHISYFLGMKLTCYAFC